MHRCKILSRTSCISASIGFRKKFKVEVNQFLTGFDGTPTARLIGVWLSGLLLWTGGAGCVGLGDGTPTARPIGVRPSGGPGGAAVVVVPDGPDHGRVAGDCDRTAEPIARRGVRGLELRLLLRLVRGGRLVRGLLGDRRVVGGARLSTRRAGARRARAPARRARGMSRRSACTRPRGAPRAFHEARSTPRGTRRS